MVLAQGDNRRSFTGRVDGARLHAVGAAAVAWSAQAGPDALDITSAAGLPGLAGQRLRRAVAASCG